MLNGELTPRLEQATGTEQRHDFAIQFTHPTPAGNRRNLDDDFDPLKDTDKGLTVEKTFTPPDVCSLSSQIRVYGTCTFVLETVEPWAIVLLMMKD